MTKICEYEKVQCPYCGCKDVEDGGFYWISERDVPFMKVHHVRCQDCLGEFYIPCED